VSHWSAVGICVDGFDNPPPPGVWQVEQRPIAVASWVYVTVAQLIVLPWQVSHCAVVATWLTGLVCAFCAR